ncbi:MAG: purine-nucleoside phosphorylase [Polyangiales bacterium]
MMEHLDEACEAIAAKVGTPEVAMVLGSGLGGYADALDDAVVVPYGAVPHMPQAKVAGHEGNLVVGTRHGKRVAILQGRPHLYEGHDPHAVVFGVRLLATLGAKTLFITNAAGAISSDLAPGDLMAIVDQINLTGRSLTGPHDERLGPRFMDMTNAFDPSLLEIAASVAHDQGFTLKRGVYVGLLGPAYETPAEVRMLRTMGADAVGMSTVLEVLAARHLGMRVLGLSCIANLGAGMGNDPLSHSEVTETAARVRGRFEALLSGVLGRV